MTSKKFTLLLSLAVSAFIPFGCFSEDASSATQKEKLVKSINEFSFQLHKKINSSFDKNAITSPFSIYTTISLLGQGARDQTSLEITKTLKLPIYNNQLAEQIDQLQDQLSGTKNDDYTLRFANSLWIDSENSILPSFRYIAEKEYKARVNLINFFDPSNTVQTINSWVSVQTEGKIDHLLSTSDISENTKMILTNAIFFDANWDRPFNSKFSKILPFYVDERTEESVMMMTQTSFFPYYENENFQMLALPLKTKKSSNQFAMIILLPKEGRSLSTSAAEMSSFIYKECLESLDSRNINVQIPKFTMNIKQNLAPVLYEMGIKSAFTKSADFSGINGLRNLSLDKVIHQAYFMVDENGLSAAAATAASMIATAAVRPVEKPITFIADRPFLYLLTDINSKTILFIGNFINPKQGS